jgi:sialate O-acetylesterase
MKKTTFLFASLALSLTAYAEVTFPAIFSTNMVLQQQSQPPIWGWAKPNATVKVSTSWDKKTYSVKSDAQGKWLVKVSTPNAAYTPYTLTADDGKPTTITNVLIGEVWLCSGQSNMEMPMRGFSHMQPVEGAGEAIAASTNAGIRCFTVKRAAKVTPQDTCIGRWDVASPATTPTFTATGYFFALRINQALNLPVGIVHTSWGGSRVEAWMPDDALNGLSSRRAPSSNDSIKSAPGTPSVLYNAMLHPLVGYGIRGALWYQGEANRNEPQAYAPLFAAMLESWRKLWGQGDFPFYFCQIAPYRAGGKYHLGYLREAQAKGLQLPNTGMAVLMDANSPDCIHPPKKKDVGERLALWALAKTYGMDKVHHRSPELKSVTPDGRVLVLTFDMFGSATGLTSYGKDIRNFQIAGANKRWYPATAALYDDKIYLLSPQVPKPIAARYCFDDASPAEVFTVEGGLPLASFRTDDW